MSNAKCQIKGVANVKVQMPRLRKSKCQSSNANVKEVQMTKFKCQSWERSNDKIQMSNQNDKVQMTKQKCQSSNVNVKKVQMRKFKLQNLNVKFKEFQIPKSKCQIKFLGYCLFFEDNRIEENINVNS